MTLSIDALNHSLNKSQIQDPFKLKEYLWNMNSNNQAAQVKALLKAKAK